MHRRVSRLRVAGAVVFGSVVALAAAASAFPSAAGASPVPCRTSGLVIWLDTQGSGAAGSTYYTLELTNLSGHACALRGYPSVRAVDLAGRRVGSGASRNPVRPQRRVILSTGRSATAVLQIVDALNFPRSRCRPRTVAGVRVAPPGASASKLVPFPFPACSRTGPVFMTVQAVRR